MNLNKVILCGRVTSDIELKRTPGGTSVCSSSLATNRVYKDASGQKKEDTQFHKIVLWGRQAEVATQFSGKGAILLIEGRIENRSWEDKNNNKRTTTEIVGESIQLGPKPGSSNITQQNNQSNYQKPKYEEEDFIDENIPVIEDGEEIDIKDIPF